MSRRGKALAILAVILVALASTYVYFHRHAVQSMQSPEPGTTTIASTTITTAWGSVVTGTLVTKNLATDYGGVSSTTINQAITDAKNYFQTNPDTVYTIHIPPGTFTIDGTIDVSGVNPGMEGRLVIEGAGASSTELVQDPSVNGIRGMKTYRTSFIGIHFTVPEQSTTQGYVISEAPGQVVVDIQPGFPTPLEEMNSGANQYNENEACPGANEGAGGWGRYLRSWIESPTDPHITDPNEQHIPWCKPVAIAGTTTEWTILLHNPTLVAPYPIGTLLSVKVKDTQSAYYFCGGDDFVFQDIEWTEWSRGIWRCGFNDVLIEHDEILRSPAIDGQVPVESSPGGGPQFGDLQGVATGGYIVKDSFFEATGDDPVAFFDATGTVEDSAFIDDTGRVNINHSQVDLENNDIERVRVVHQ